MRTKHAPVFGLARASTGLAMSDKKKIIQRQIAYTTKGDKTAPSIFSREEPTTISADNIDAFKAALLAVPSPKDWILESLATIEQGAAERLKRAGLHPDGAQGPIEQMSTSDFARKATNHVRRARRQLADAESDPKHWPGAMESGMQAVYNWGQMILSIHEPSILRALVPLQKQRAAGIKAALENSGTATSTRQAVLKAERKDKDNGGADRGRVARIARATGISRQTVAKHLKG